MVFSKKSIQNSFKLVDKPMKMRIIALLNVIKKSPSILNSGGFFYFKKKNLSFFIA